MDAQSDQDIQGGAGYNVFGSFSTFKLSIGFYVTLVYIWSDFTLSHEFLPFSMTDCHFRFP